MLAQGAHDQKQHEHGRDCLERADKQVTQDADGRGLRQDETQEDAQDQAADDALDQADLIPAVYEVFHVFLSTPLKFQTIFNYIILFCI